MAAIMSLVTYFTSHQAVIYGVLFAMSEALAFIPGISANSVFQMVFNFLKGKQAAGS